MINFIWAVMVLASLPEWRLRSRLWPEKASSNSLAVTLKRPFGRNRTYKSPKSAYADWF